MKFFFVFYIFLGFFLLFVIVFLVCGDDVVVQFSELVGCWEIKEVFWDGKVIDIMEGMYFEFFEDGQLVINMMGVVEIYSFELDGDEIEQCNGMIEIDYIIEMLEEVQLVLIIILWGKVFCMVFQFVVN